MEITLIEAYQILGIDANATLDELRTAYHLAVEKTQPNNLGENKDIRKIDAAYEMVAKIIKNKQELDLTEIKRTQEAARAKAQAKAKEQARREEERKKREEAEHLRLLKKVYEDLLQSREFKRINLPLDKFTKDNNNPECSKWRNIHYFANNIHSRREKYIKEYMAQVDEKNASINEMIPFTELNPNPVTQNKKQQYKSMINQKYGTIGDAIDTVCNTFNNEINYLTKCFDFSDSTVISYLIGDEKYRKKIFKKAENRLASFYKIAKYIYSKPECLREIDDEFLKVDSSRFQTEITRMKNIENYVNHVYVFKEDGTISINNDNITRTEYQQAREWLNVIRANNRSNVERSTIIVYMNYIAGCLEFIYTRIPHPEFNPNVKPDKLLEIAKVIKTLEKYYLLALEDGITDCYNTYLKVKDEPEYKDKNLSTVLEILLELNKKRRIINKYYLHSYYSLEEIVKMKKEEQNLLYKNACSYEQEIEEYKTNRPDNNELVELYLKKLKDNKKFAPLFNEDVTFIEIMQFLESKKLELDNLSSKNKPSLAAYIFYNENQLSDLRLAPIYEGKIDFIKGHSKEEIKNIEKLSRHQIDQLYRSCVISFLNENHPKYKDKCLDNASFGRLDTTTINNLIAQAEDAIITSFLLNEISTGFYNISEDEIKGATPEERVQLLKRITNEKKQQRSSSSPYTKQEKEV